MGVSERSRAVQGPRMAALRIVRAALVLVPVLALGGCGNGVGNYDPVVWWHHLEGGAIAENRPPPPGINAPYPSLAQIPAKPQALSEAARAQAAQTLLANRANGQYTLAQAVPAVTPQATTPPAPAPGAMGAHMAAVGEPAAGQTAPPPAAPAPAATAAATAAPTTSPTPAPTTAGSPVPAAGALAALTVPAGPPAPPNLPGVPWLTRPAPLPKTPPTPPARPQAGTGAPVSVGFAHGSAVLSPDARAALARLAGARGASVVAVSGFGEARDSDPAAQTSALGLAWERATAIGNALRQDGVPASSLTLDAYAPGGGGAARLVPAG